MATARMVIAVVAAARVPGSSTSTRARCRIRPVLLLARAGDQFLEVPAGAERGPEVELAQRLGEVEPAWC